jgi:hypothetical protein
VNIDDPMDKYGPRPDDGDRSHDWYMDPEREDFHPPGQPPAEALADEFADLVVVDGPNAGQVWTYEASKGGYQIADPDGRAADDTSCTSPAAVIAHTGAEVVRPVEER